MARSHVSGTRWIGGNGRVLKEYRSPFADWSAPPGFHHSDRMARSYRLQEDDHFQWWNARRHFEDYGDSAYLDQMLLHVTETNPPDAPKAVVLPPASRNRRLEITWLVVSLFVLTCLFFTDLVLYGVI